MKPKVWSRFSGKKVIQKLRQKYKGSIWVGVKFSPKRQKRGQAGIAAYGIVASSGGGPGAEVGEKRKNTLSNKTAGKVCKTHGLGKEADIFGDRRGGFSYQLNNIQGLSMRDAGGGGGGREQILIGATGGKAHPGHRRKIQRSLQNAHEREVQIRTIESGLSEKSKTGDRKHREEGGT